MIPRSIPVRAAALGFLALFLAQPGCIAPTVQSDVIASIEVFGNAEVTVGSSIPLHTIRKNASGSTISAPGNISWSSSNSTVATVNAQSGVVTGVQAGAVSITASSGSVSGFKTIEVKPPPAAPVNTVTVSGPASVKKYLQITLQATLRDAAGNEIFRNVTWISSEPAKATVGFTDGVVTGVAEGTVTITATSEGKTGTAQVTIAPPAVDHVVIRGFSAVDVGQAVDFDVSTYDQQNRELDRPVIWLSSDPTKASVTVSGLVTGIAVGSTTITVTSEGKSAFQLVNVNQPMGSTRLTGRVVDGTNGNGLSNATVRVIRVDPVSTLNTVTSGADGTFTTLAFGVTSSGVYVEAERTGYVTGRILITTGLTGDPVATEPIPLVPTSGSKGAISGVVRNARTAAAIPGASLALYNNLAAAPVAPGTADGNGIYTFSDLAAGTYRVAATAPGFQLAERVGIAVGNGGVTGGQDLVLSPTGTNDIRIVLTWGSSPNDLDSHLTGPNGAGRFHVYFGGGGNFNAAPFAGLDVDDTNGFGPETISITQVAPGNYRYSVHDFTNRNSASSTALGNSGAKVRVYSSTGLLDQISVPTGVGNLWTVFEMSGTLANPVIVRRNELSFHTDAGSVPAPPAALKGSGETDTDLIARAVRRLEKGQWR